MGFLSIQTLVLLFSSFAFFVHRRFSMDKRRADDPKQQEQHGKAIG